MRYSRLIPSGRMRGMAATHVLSRSSFGFTPLAVTRRQKVKRQPQEEETVTLLTSEPPQHSSQLEG